MTEVSEIEIKSMTKEQNYMQGYKDGKNDVLDKIRAEIMQFAENPNFGDLSLGVSCGAMKTIEIINKYRDKEQEE